MSNEDDRKQRLKAMLEDGALFDEAERAAILHIEKGTLLSDPTVERIVLAFLLSRSNVTPAAGELLAALARLPSAVLPALRIVCTECGKRLPHETDCSASTDPEACS